MRDWERECRFRHFLHGINEIKNIFRKSASWHDLFIMDGQRKATRNKTNKIIKHSKGRRQIMKKKLGTMVAAVAVVLLTASFSFAEVALGGAGASPTSSSAA